jgi:transcription initiation factor TFIIIB Brf1 subunit/transcription initiation factor TFIIB
MIRNIHEVKECPDCASDNIIYDDERDQVICRDCGLIFEPLAPGEEERFEFAHGAAPEPKPKTKPAKKPAKKAKKKK